MPDDLMWEMTSNCKHCHICTTLCDLASCLQHAACLESGALRIFLPLGCGRKQDMAELGIGNKELQVCF